MWKLCINVPFCRESTVNSLIVTPAGNTCGLCAVGNYLIKIQIQPLLVAMKIKLLLLLIGQHCEIMSKYLRHREVLPIEVNLPV